MRRHSLVGRLTLLQQVLAAAVIVSFAVSSLWLTDRTLRNDERHMLAEAARRVAKSIDDELKERGDLARAATDAMNEEIGLGIRIDAFDPHGRTLASTGGRTPTMTGVLPAPGEIQEIGGVNRAAARSTSGALVVASISTSVRLGQISGLARTLIWCAIPLLLVSILVSHWSARRALRPLVAIEARARSASAEVGVRSLGEPSGMEEMDRLGESFNRLLARLDDRLRSERRFTSDASHELRTPLTVLSGELEVALSSSSLAPDIRAGLERAAGQVRGMRELVEALLLLRRAGADALEAERSFEPVNLADIAADVVRATSAHHPDRAADLSLTAPDEAMVSGHPALLASAMGNLVDNAMKFTQAGQPVQVTVASQGPDATVTVDDGGGGIADQEQDRIFDPFFRGADSRANHSGFGLGLPILRQVARAHGGDVTVKPSPLGGARFVLSLPAWRAKLEGPGGGRPVPQAIGE